MQLEPVVEEAAPMAQRRLLPWIVAAVCIAGMVALGFLYIRQPKVQTRTLRFSVLPPERAAFRPDSIPAISPDGRSLAFVATTAGKDSLWVRDLDSLTARQLAGTDGAYSPFWSPDSHTIAFFAGGKLKKIDAAGGPPLTLCDGAGEGGSWNKNDVIVFSPEISGGLFRVSAGGGSATPVTILDTGAGELSHRYPWFLPDGRHFLYSAVSISKPAIYVADLDSNSDLKTRRLLVAASSNAVFTQPGYLLFLREQTLLAQPFDAGKAQTTGDPIPIAEQVDFVSNRGQGEFSASRDGVLAYRSGGARKAQLTWFDRSGRMQGMVGPPGTMQYPAISPDGGSVMIDRLDPDTGFYDLWRYDLARNTSSRFTKRGQSPVWSPDGKQVASNANVDGRPHLYQKAFGGTGQDEVLDKSERMSYPEDWARDGRFLIETVQDPNTTLHIWVLPLFGDRKPFPYLQSEFNQWQAKLSPDGRWLAYMSDETSRYEIYVQSFPTPGEKSLISTNGGTYPAWSRNGKELFFIGADRKLMATAVQTGATFKAGVPKALFETRLPSGITRFNVSQDGRFLIPTEVDSGGGAAVNIIVNWTAGLRK